MRSFAPPPLTADEVRAYREETGSGIMEAKRVLKARKDLVEIENVWNRGTVIEQIGWLLDREKARIMASASTDGS